MIVISALSGCVVEAPGENVNSNLGPVAAIAPVALEEMQADQVTAFDVINRSRSQVTRTGEIYMMRGLANVFSRGIDEMATELRNDGYDAANFSYRLWPKIAEDVVSRASRKQVSYPVIIIGHSLGANESSKFANYLTSNNVNVDLVVAFDPVETGSITKGVKKVVNYYLPKSEDIRIGSNTKAEDNTIHASNDFDGILNNIDVSSDPTITHLNIDKHLPYQTATLSNIKDLTGTRKKRARTKHAVGDGR